MPAPKNPYRERDLGWTDLDRTHEGAQFISHGEAFAPARTHEFPLMAGGVRAGVPGFTSTDIQHIAERNYELGRRDGYADRNGEVEDLKRAKREVPPKAYDEGYDAGETDAEREALDQIIALLGPARVMADELQGRPGRRRLTPKQQESVTAELTGYVVAITNVLHSLEPLVEDDGHTVNDARTPEGITALREFVAKQGKVPFPFTPTDD